MGQARRQLLQESFKLGTLLIMTGSLGLAIADKLARDYKVAWVALPELVNEHLKGFHFLLFVALLIAWQLIFASQGLYRNLRLATATAETVAVLRATSLGSFVVVMAGYFFRLELVDPQFVLVFWAASSGFTVVSFLLARAILEQARIAGRNLRYMLVIGTNERARAFAAKIEAKKALGIKLVGYVDEEWEGMEKFRQEGGMLVCSFEGMAEYVRENPVDEVVIALPLCSSYERSARIVKLCQQQGLTIRFISDIFNLSLARAKIDKVDGEPIITLHNTGAMQGWTMLAKRGLDLVISTLLLILLLPLLLVVGLLVRLTSRGPALFVQERVGLNKRRFPMFKFRTMVENAEQQQKAMEHLNEVSGPVFKIRNDPRVTPLGRFLRRSSIDELPQLLNVFLGDMSLVGPRPLPQRDYEGFDRDWHRRRLSVRPGITGLWQVHGRSNIDFERWMELDRDYIDNWTLWLDIKILLMTLPVVVSKGGGEFSKIRDRPAEVERWRKKAAERAAARRRREESSSDTTVPIHHEA